MSLPFKFLPETPDYSVPKKPPTVSTSVVTVKESIYPGLDDIYSTHATATVQTRVETQPNMKSGMQSNPYSGFYSKESIQKDESDKVISDKKEGEASFEEPDDEDKLVVKAQECPSFITPIHKTPHMKLDIRKKRILTIPFAFSAAYFKKVGDLGACVVSSTFQELKESFGREQLLRSRPPNVTKAAWLSSLTSKLVKETMDSTVCLLYSVKLLSSWNNSPFNMALFMKGMPCDIAYIDLVHCTLGIRRNHSQVCTDRYIIEPPSDYKVYDNRASELGVLSPSNILSRMAMGDPKNGSLVWIKRDSPYMKAILQHKDKIEGLTENEIVSVLGGGSGEFATAGMAAHHRFMETIGESRARDLNVLDDDFKCQFIRTHGSTDVQEFKVDKRFRDENGQFSMEAVEKSMDIPYECGVELEVECRFMI